MVDVITFAIASELTFLIIAFPYDVLLFISQVFPILASDPSISCIHGMHGIQGIAGIASASATLAIQLNSALLCSALVSSRLITT